MKVAFYTLGCKVNQYESQALGEMLKSRGHEIVSPDSDADAYVIHSCTVTAVSDAKSRKSVNHYRRKHPNAVIALIGCYVQAFEERAKAIEGADIILGTKDKSRLVCLLEECYKNKNREVSVLEHTKDAKFEPMNISSFDERNRAFVKIQDGCNRFCSYCIIPYARGRSCSKPINELVKEVEGLVKNGYGEIVLVGIDLSFYGREFSKTLTDAVEAVSKVEGVKRIRLGSLEPEVISDEDIERLKKIDNFCPQFHLSLQSGSDTTLKRMNRHYDSSVYREIVLKLKKAFEHCSVTTDVMVGFAGETEEEFNESLEFVKEMRFLKVHVFPYSVREGTKAAEFAEQINPEIKKKRSHIMIEETEKIREEILKSQLNREAEILLEGKQKNGYYMGYTVDYIPVYVKECDRNENDIVKVKIDGVIFDGCSGKIV